MQIIIQKDDIFKNNFTKQVIAMSIIQPSTSQTLDIVLFNQSKAEIGEIWRHNFLTNKVISISF